MPCDLEVDTDELRRAAGLLHLTADLFATPGRWYGPVAGERDADGPAAFREAVRLAVARSDQCLECADSLSARADQLSRLLRDAATSFDRAEMLCSAGG